MKLQERLCECENYFCDATVASRLIYGREFICSAFTPHFSQCRQNTAMNIKESKMQHKLKTANGFADFALIKTWKNVEALECIRSKFDLAIGSIPHYILPWPSFLKQFIMQIVNS